MEQRLALLYLANDALQNSKKKQLNQLVEVWAPAVVRFDNYHLFIFSSLSCLRVYPFLFARLRLFARHTTICPTRTAPLHRCVVCTPASQSIVLAAT
jgi:hypothetical protein